MATARGSGQAGYAMVALLVGISIMAVALSVALPSWSAMAKREREEELIFRAQQYARAIALYQRRYANAYPPNIDVLVQQKFLRKRYKDPMTEDGEFQLILVGQPIPGQGDMRVINGRTGEQTQLGGSLMRTTIVDQQGRVATSRLGGTGAGVLGVVSKSDATSMRLFNGRNKYNEWAFVATDATTAAGSRRGGNNPDAPGANPGRGMRMGTPQRGGQPQVPQPRRGTPFGNPF